ncbi:hypothetical protein BO86DRAFT_390987 [Aspergillus japonicus CBS 114.51]|uniref:Uncharacterized protein n=2 Tax=Aspergillus TaxID=5052 RepID=A0A2V5GW66_ASPV1|nr:hypothetical protein BO86DRAFT_390987 [Aspergillus japonicus CBS 114.51]PYI15545.1 hypothetical protein BO99DRAFT_405791 [Aspergillus violaceofuscus CBS 115571]RAH79429.1 hypothetical protein BO86DRAFT_390987 [Aspergillus japonicus CBS 114.51]
MISSICPIITIVTVIVIVVNDSKLLGAIWRWGPPGTRPLSQAGMTSHPNRTSLL